MNPGDILKAITDKDEKKNTLIQVLEDNMIESKDYTSCIDGITDVIEMVTQINIATDNFGSFEKRTVCYVNMLMLIETAITSLKFSLRKSRDEALKKDCNTKLPEYDLLLNNLRCQLRQSISMLREP